MNTQQVKCEVCNAPAKIVRAEENYTRCAKEKLDLAIDALTDIRDNYLNEQQCYTVVVDCLAKINKGK